MPKFLNVTLIDNTDVIINVDNISHIIDNAVYMVSMEEDDSEYAEPGHLTPVIFVLNNESYDSLSDFLDENDL